MTSSSSAREPGRSHPAQVPPGINTNVAHPARMYDYYLGGKDNFPADREAAEKMIASSPGMRDGARQNRAFLGRAVRWLAAAGISQFLDIGTGIPTQGNTHEVAQEVVPDACVAYVDNDPIVIAHARALLGKQGRGRVTIAQADLRQPDAILTDPEVLHAIDFDRPLAVLLVAILMFLEDSEDPYRIVERLKAAMPSGSYLVISHVTQDFNPEAAARGARAYDKATARMTMRSHADVLRFFDGLQLVDPGLVQVSRWRPDGEVPNLPGGHPWVWAGVGLKP
jgi:S-adenosyl methyltransferase